MQPVSPRTMVARQPICTSDQRTYGYELLWRNALGNPDVISNPDAATAQVVIGSFMEIGLDRLIGRSKAFVNVTRDFILENYCHSLPKDRIVFEILEDIDPDEKFMKAIVKLTRKGYSFALDDYTFEERRAPLLPYCKFIKVDVRRVDRLTVVSHIESLRQSSARLLAEKVETAEEFEFYRDLGFDFFQGYFFCKPSVFSGTRISGNRLAVCRLLAKIYQPEIETREIEKIVGEDLPLSYRILRYINSACVALPKEIESISHAVRLVGTEQIRLLASLMMLASLETKPQELMTTSLIRARMCEVLAERLGYKDSSKHFTVGLFSTIDAFLDCRLEEALQLLPFSKEIQEALLDHTGALGNVLRQVQLYEVGDWGTLEKLRANSESMSDAYMHALEFGENLVQQIGTLRDPEPAAARLN